MLSGFIWYELITSDPAAAANFYGQVLGWKAADSGKPGMDYRILWMNGSGVGGMMAIPAAAEKAGMKPAWLGYIHVEDVDKSIKAIVAAGGAEHMPATDIPEVGRIAMIADPQGANIYIMKPAGTGTSTAFSPGLPGHAGWHELHTKDGAAALAFYSKQFGWRKSSEMDMGPMGVYHLFNVGSEEMAGGMMSDPKASRPHWLYYFNVDDIDAAHRRVTKHGGEVLVEPHQVPTGTWIIQARDPQGAAFALVGPKK
jgi:predicted enzyme related to lactoylglutathione lyase